MKSWTVGGETSRSLEAISVQALHWLILCERRRGIEVSVRIIENLNQTPMYNLV